MMPKLIYMDAYFEPVWSFYWSSTSWWWWFGMGTEVHEHYYSDLINVASLSLVRLHFAPTVVANVRDSRLILFR